MPKGTEIDNILCPWKNFELKILFLHKRRNNVKVLIEKSRFTCIFEEESDRNILEKGGNITYIYILKKKRLVSIQYN